MEDFLLDVLNKALKLTLVLDPFANAGIIATLISSFDKSRQRKILYREICISLLLLLIFFFVGAKFLNALAISQSAITLTGSMIFFLFAISLLFPSESSVLKIKSLSEEPFIVPIAIPLICGPSSIATAILFSHNSSQWWQSLAAIFLAWGFSGFIILLGPFLLIKLGKTGTRVVENFIGLICTLVAVKMFIVGISLFIQGLK